MSGPRRRPAEETEHYPNVWVADNRVGGLPTISRSRLPLEAVIWSLTQGGWSEVLEGWPYIEDDYKFKADDMARFLHNLLYHRGEFGRLLVVLADVNRREAEKNERENEEHFAEAHPGENVCECGLGWPTAWWDDPDLSSPVLDQLRRCVEVLEGGS